MTYAFSVKSVGIKAVKICILLPVSHYPQFTFCAFDGLKTPLASRLKSVGWGTKRDIFYTTYRKCSGARQDERAEKQELPAHMEGFEIEYAPRENGR